MAERLDFGDRARLLGAVGAAAILGLVAGVNPPLAVGMALAVGFVGLALANFTVALALFCYEPAGLGVDESLLARVALLVLVLAWVGNSVNRRRGIDFFSEHPGMSWVLVVFLGWTLLSVTWAEDQALALDACGQFAAAIAIFAMTFSAVRTRRQAFTVGAILVAGGVAAAVVSIFSASGVEAERLASGSTGANELAAILVAAAAVAVGLALPKTRAAVLRLGAWSAAIFCLFAVYLTVSRGALISLAAMMVAAIGFGGRWRAGAAVAAVLVATSTVFYFAALAPQEARERVERTTEGQSHFKEGRTTLWTVAERMAEAHPIAGVGAGNFKVAARQYLLRPGAVADSTEVIEEPKVAHSSYLEVLTGLGIIGLVLFLWIVGFAFFSAVKAARRFGEDEDLAGQAFAIGVTVAIIGVLVADIFLSQQAEKQVWMLLGLGPALLAVAGSRARPTPDGGRP